MNSPFLSENVAFQIFEPMSIKKVIFKGKTNFGKSLHYGRFVDEWLA